MREQALEFCGFLRLLSSLQVKLCVLPWKCAETEKESKTCLWEEEVYIQSHDKHIWMVWPSVYTCRDCLQLQNSKALALTRFQKIRRPELAFAFSCTRNLLEPLLPKLFYTFSSTNSNHDINRQNLIICSNNAISITWAQSEQQNAYGKQKTIPPSGIQDNSLHVVCPWSCLARSVSWIGSYQPCHPSRAAGSEPCAKVKLSFKLLLDKWKSSIILTQTVLVKVQATNRKQLSKLE